MQTKSKKKILFVITQGTWGGAQRYVYDVATNLQSDWEVVVAIGGNTQISELRNSLHDAGVCCKHIRTLVRPIRPLADIRGIFALRRFYKDEQPDIVHLNSSKAGILGSFAALLCKTQRPQIVYTAHGWVFLEPLSWLRKTIYSILERMTARIKDAVVVLSKHDEDAAVNTVRVPQQKLHRIPPGISPESHYLTQSQARQEIEKHAQRVIPRNVPWIGVVANHYKTKGLDVLLNAAALMQRQGAQFLIIGDGPERKTLEKLIEQKQLQNIAHLLGYVEAAGPLLPAFDIYVQPSRKEGFPYSILEAMLALRPIVASRVGGVPTAIEHKNTGLLVEPGDAVALAHTLEYAIEHSDDMQICAQRAGERLPQYSLTHMLNETTALYRSLL